MLLFVFLLAALQANYRSILPRKVLVLLMLFRLLLLPSIANIANLLGVGFFVVLVLGAQSQAFAATPVTELGSPSGTETATETANYDKTITVSQVTILGNKLVPSEQILSAMSIRPGAVYSKKALQEDLRQVYDLGYFTERMKAVPKATRSGIIVTLQVEENTPVTGVEIKGNSRLTQLEVDEIFATQIGMPQNLSQLNKGIEKLEAKYAEKGFVLAKVGNIADSPDGSVKLDVNEGIVDKIQYVGNRKTKDFVIKRSLSIKEGEVYNETVLNDDLKRLFATQAFDDVRRVLTASPDDPTHYNLVIEVDEKRSGAFNVGGGIDTVTGFFGSGGYSDPNFLGRGENFNVTLGVGSGVLGRNANVQANTRTYQFDLGWSTPAFLQTDNALSVNAYGRDLGSFNIPLAIERRIGSGITIGRGLKDKPNWSTSLGLRGEYVALREGGAQVDLNRFGITPALRKTQLDKGMFLTLTPTVAYDTRDNRFDPSSGWFNSVSLGGTAGLGADSYGTASVNLRKYLKLSNFVTLALNGQVTTSVAGDLPAFNALNLGGAYSVRGFQQGGLGIGSGFALGSVELRSKVPGLDKLKKVPFLESTRIVAFVDGGQLINENDGINNLFQRKGYGYSGGLGVRINIPGLGPIRLDYAVPLTATNKNYIQHFGFGIGQKF
jgi:outer membrane protein insertion porin family